VPEYFLHSVDSRIENVPVEREAVRHSFWVRRNGASEAVQIYVLATVVILKDISDRSDRLNVLVFQLVRTVERARVIVFLV